ncbi:uncharacterized protein PG998_014245 [Apiospora kogelbergensis]|uniref:uncharacterized protein n=1 Tax=Apiospora kogelbergensis TaxID=1337665 RepID=UPI00312EFF18
MSHAADLAVAVSGLPALALGPAAVLVDVDLALAGAAAAGGVDGEVLLGVLAAVVVEAVGDVAAGAVGLTGFMMGIIGSTLVVTRADRRGKAKSDQPGNRERSTAIECINSQGCCMPPFLIVQGKYHLSSWAHECDLPRDWVIKPTPNGWTDNETVLDWIKHFDKHTQMRSKGPYRLLILDGHESHISAEFEVYCKDNKIVTLSMPPHPSHLL